MAYCNGRNLEDLIECRGFLSEAEVHFIIKQMVGAFLSIQEKGIVHRDLKPGNIMLHFENYPERRLPDHLKEQEKMFESQLTQWHFEDLTVSKPIVKIVDFGHSFNGLNQEGDEICKGNPMTLCP